MDESKWDFIDKIKIRYTDESDLREQHGEFLDFFHFWVEAIRRLDKKLRAYLIYMTRRLMEMHRILKSTGSIYLHCDQCASHYLKILMDGIFGKDNFRSEIIWYYKNASRGKSNFANSHDVILYFCKNYEECSFKTDEILVPFESGMTEWRYTKGGQKGKKNQKEKTPDNVITLPSLNTMAKERLGYQTQKPIELLKKFILASCPEDGVVMDPFCGCGTTIYASQHLKRKWIGIDIGILGIHLIRDVLETKIQGTKSEAKNLYFKSLFFNKDIKDKELKEKEGLKEKRDFFVSGIPETAEQAKDFWTRSHLEFEKWIVLKCLAIPTKSTGDGGVDGKLDFYDSVQNLKDSSTLEIKKESVKIMILSVKGGTLKASDIRDLIGTVEKERAQMGGLICFDEPTSQMKEAMNQMGYYENKTNRLKYKKIQYLTVEQILKENKLFELPNRPNRSNYNKYSQIRMDV